MSGNAMNLTGATDAELAALGYRYKLTGRDPRTPHAAFLQAVARDEAGRDIQVRAMESLGWSVTVTTLDPVPDAIV